MGRGGVHLEVNYFLRFFQNHFYEKAWNSSFFLGCTLQLITPYPF